MLTKTKLIAAASTVAAVSALGVGVAVADPSPSAPTTTASPSATSTAKAGKAGKADHKKDRKDLLKSALHGEVTLGGAKKHRVLDFQRGTVSSVNGTTVTVKSVDGFTATYTADSKTKVHLKSAKGKAESLSAVKVNDRVRVIGTKSGSTITLRSLGDAGPKK